MLFFNFANSWVENTFGGNFLPQSTHRISQGIKATSSKQIYSSYALKHTLITEAHSHFTLNLSLFFHAWIVKYSFSSWVLTKLSAPTLKQIMFHSDTPCFGKRKWWGNVKAVSTPLM